MTQLNALDNEPPSAGRRLHLAPPVSAHEGQSISSRVKGRRGRPRQEDYAKRVSAILRSDLIHLDECASLAQLPGVQALARQQRAIFPTGMAIRLLLDQAVSDVEGFARANRDVTSQRIVTFLHLWYREHGTVVTVAEALHLSRSHVAHCIQRRALDLVVRRFLELAWRVERSA